MPYQYGPQFADVQKDDAAVTQTNLMSYFSVVMVGTIRRSRSTAQKDSLPCRPSSSQVAQTLLV